MRRHAFVNPAAADLTSSTIHQRATAMKFNRIRDQTHKQEKLAHQVICWPSNNLRFEDASDSQQTRTSSTVPNEFAAHAVADAEGCLAAG